ncbi:MAG: methyltransferase domain-containing protein [Chitinophagaceae bacterium]|nr:methyltransferase domain-containing protein [Chitinophagaceae bacterium]
MTTSPIWKHRLFIILRISSKTLYKLLGKTNERIQPLEFFSVKAGYHHAANAESFDSTCSSDEFQRSVYDLADSFALKFDDASILDVGCGSGYKLVHMLGQYQTTGIEVEPVYSWLLQKYPDRKWLPYQSIGMAELNADIVICSDVIEHIKNPDELMDFLKKINFRYLILSTPERDKICGKNDYGPPENTSHYREWNTSEFKLYVSRWFNIHEHHVFNDKSISQVAVCSKKPAS